MFQGVRKARKVPETLLPLGSPAGVRFPPLHGQHPPPPPEQHVRTPLPHLLPARPAVQNHRASGSGWPPRRSEGLGSRWGLRGDLTLSPRLCRLWLLCPSLENALWREPRTPRTTSLKATPCRKASLCRPTLGRCHPLRAGDHSRHRAGPRPTILRTRPAQQHSHLYRFCPASHPTPNHPFH